MNDRIGDRDLSTLAFRMSRTKRNPATRRKQQNGKAYFADLIWEFEGGIGDIARMTGPQDSRFRSLMNSIILGVTSHQILAAARLGDNETMTRMIDDGVDLNITNRQGQTALHVAAQNDRVETVRLLLGTRKVDIDFQDMSGNTALHFAIRRNGTYVTGIVRSLLEAGASPNQRADEDELTPARASQAAERTTRTGRGALGPTRTSRPR